MENTILDQLLYDGACVILLVFEVAFVLILILGIIFGVAYFFKNIWKKYIGGGK